MKATHRDSNPRTPEYNAWQNMRQRVKRSPYVERGITVCERWGKFENFLADMGEKPDGLTLSRIDDDGGFEPGNCEWATRAERPANRTHGHNRDGKRSPTYGAWSNMIQRTTNPKATGYSYYADRGITVCERWRESFEAFLADMGERPEGMSIDRIDNDGNYEPGNCRWADWSVQMKNRRRSEASIANLERAPGRVKAAAKRVAAS